MNRGIKANIKKSLLRQSILSPLPLLDSVSVRDRKYGEIREETGMTCSKGPWDDPGML